MAAIKASIWFTEVESFRDQEEEALAQGKYEQTLDEHRAALGLLIGTGERIAFDIKTVGLPPSFSEFGLEDLMVTLNSLHVTFNCQHGTKNPDVLNAGIEKLLNVEESKD